VSHWLGALVTSREIIGTLGITPVRAVINAAAALVPGERHCLCVVGDHTPDGLHFATFGDPQRAWAAASEVASRTHIVHLEEPVERALSIVPERYSDLWTGAKGFYKVEPVVADGGEVILYAPHITELATTHPGLAHIGYHCRDYFLANWESFVDHPWSELAHSTHLFGAGTYASDGTETQRVRVTLATGIPPEVVRSVNLRAVDPASIDLDEFARSPRSLVVPDAGEVLFRLRDH
jgi:nickel-dependent lactate racemase